MRPIKVDFIHKNFIGFLATQSLYEEMLKDDNFNIRILIHERFMNNNTLTKLKQKNINIRVYPHDLRPTDYFIVTCPYFIDFETLHKITPKIAYINYGFCPKTPIVFPDVNIQRDFIWKQFVGDKFNKCAVEILGDAEQIMTLGHPKYDAYFRFRGDRKTILTQLGLDPNKKTILYTPTLQSPSVSWLHRYSTFASVGLHVLNLADKFNANLIVKAHPFLFGETPEEKQALLPQKNQFMKVINTSSNIIISYTEDYIPYFYASDCCISDTSSMLYEYIITGKPLLTVFSQECVYSSIFTNPLPYYCYNIPTPEVLEDTLKELLRGKDGQKKKRLRFIKESFTTPDGQAGYRIKEYIKQDFERENNELT